LLALGLMVPAGAYAAHGATLWNGGCDNCHNPGGAPPWPQKNAAGSTGTTILFMLPFMGCAYADGLSATERDHIAQYLETLLPAPIDTTTNINTPKLINVTGYLDIASTAFNFVETAVAPSAGSLSAWSGYTVTYTPPSSTFVGDITFGFRGSRTSPAHNGNTHTVSIRVGDVPNITPASPSGTVGTFFSYTITATNAPTSYGHTGTLPAGVTRVNNVISGTPTAVGAGSFPITVSATNALGTDNQAVTITINPGTPTVATFPAQASQVYSPGGTFAISPPATLSPSLADSQLNPTYTSQTTGVCTMPGNTSTTVTIVAAGPGPCTIRATSVSNANWNASSNFLDSSITINQASKSINWVATQTPASQNWAFGGTFPINTATTTPLGQTITYGSSTGTICSVAGTTVTSLRAGLCTLTANSAANTNYTAATQQTSNVTINAVQPAAPAIGTGTPGDTQAFIAFTPLTTANDGGASILQYTATCNPGGITGTSATTPITVNGLTNAQPYTCSVTATQVAPHSHTSLPRARWA
jgi:hypothetical protein